MDQHDLACHTALSCDIRATRAYNPESACPKLTRCSSWDDWVQTDRLRKLTEENLEIARTLKAQADAKLKALDPKSAIKKKAKADSDFSSNRGSEDRQVGGTATGRGQKRGRGDIDIEKVSGFCLYSLRCALSQNMVPLLLHFAKAWSGLAVHG